MNFIIRPKEDGTFRVEMHGDIALEDFWDFSSFRDAQQAVKMVHERIQHTFYQKCDSYCFSSETVPKCRPQNQYDNIDKTTSEQLNVEECDEFKKLCAPLVEYIQKKYGSPHHYIIIDWSSAMIVQNLRSVDFKPPD